MYKWVIRRMIRANVRKLAAGDPGPLLSGYAANATLVFPGSSSWGGEHRGRAAIEAFLHRFLDAGLVGRTHEILVNGPPWRTLVCVRFTDEAHDADGTLVYSNRAVLFARIVWGRIVYQEDYEDTEKVAEFDRYLAGRG